MPKIFKTYLPTQGSLCFEFLDQNVNICRAINQEDGSIWYFSSKAEVTGGDYFTKEAADFQIERVVTAGRIYQMLLPHLQPTMVSCKGEDGIVYRFSKEVADFTTWKKICELATFATDANLVKIKNAAYKAIKELIKIIIVGYFLFDDDVGGSNYGLSERYNVNSAYYAVKIDPEGGLGNKDFFQESAEEIYQQLKNWGMDRLSGELENDDIVNGLESIKIFKDKMGFINSILNILVSENNISQSKEILQRLLLTEEAQTEKFEILSEIISTPLRYYAKIIEDCISDKYQQQKSILTKGLEDRIARFKEAAMRLQGFPEFFQEYSKMPYHAGSASNPSYNCYTPKYDDEKTFNQFKERIIEVQTPRTDESPFYTFFKKIDFHIRPENSDNSEQAVKKQKTC